MLRFFRAVKQRFHSDKVFTKVLELSKRGDKGKAFELCQDLVKSYQYEVQIRQRLVILQRELGKEINLPNIAPANQ